MFSGRGIMQFLTVLIFYIKLKADRLLFFEHIIY
jgi:hypothetical protein